MTPLGAERQAITEQPRWFPPALANSGRSGRRHLWTDQDRSAS